MRQDILSDSTKRQEIKAQPRLVETTDREPCRSAKLRAQEIRQKYMSWSQVESPFAAAVWLDLLSTVRGSTLCCRVWLDLRSTKRRPWNFGYTSCAARGYCHADDNRAAVESGPNRRRWCRAGISHFCRIANPPEHSFSAHSRGRIAGSGDRGHQCSGNAISGAGDCPCHSSQGLVPGEARRACNRALFPLLLLQAARAGLVSIQVARAR